MSQLRSQIICGMYGIDMCDGLNECWKEIRGLLPHSGVTPELARKFIGHSQKVINDFISNNIRIGI